MAAQLRGKTGFQSHRASIEVGLGLIDLAAGDVTGATARLNAALAPPQALYGFVYVAAQHGRARIAALRGDVAGAREMLAHALDYSANLSLLPEYIRSAIEIARVERDFGDAPSALPLLQHAAALARAADLVPLAAAASALSERIAAATASHRPSSTNQEWTVS